MPGQLAGILTEVVLICQSGVVLMLHLQIHEYGISLHLFIFLGAISVQQSCSSFDGLIPRYWCFLKLW